MIIDTMRQINWLGHDSFRLTLAGKVIYIDPFQLSGNNPPADIIMITHDHYDHCSVDDIKQIAAEHTIFVTEPMSAEKIDGNVRLMAPGDFLEIDGIEVQAVAAYNTNKKFHPKENNWLGFLLTFGGVTIYHAGDTDLIPEMKDISADIALLPVSGTYVMTAAEAVSAALDIKPEIAVPMHYDTLVGTSADAEEFYNTLEGEIRVEILS